MSLDVYIKNKKKEDREWVANITHNMNKMAQRIFVSCLLYTSDAADD